MDWNKLIVIGIQLGIFSLYITSSLEVIKGISALGVKGIFTQLWETLWNNKPMKSETFPVMNFAFALLMCYAFNVTIMSYIFNNVLAIGGTGSSDTQKFIAPLIDYFGTASLTYLGSHKLFEKFIRIKEDADLLVTKTTKTAETSTKETTTETK